MRSMMKDLAKSEEVQQLSCALSSRMGEAMHRGQPPPRARRGGRQVRQGTGREGYPGVEQRSRRELQYAAAKIDDDGERECDHFLESEGDPPYGSSPDTKLMKSDARDLQLRVHALLDADQRKLRWRQSFMHNHQISAEVLHAQQEDPKSMCDRIQSQLMRHDIKVHGKSIHSGLEVSPARKMRLREWFDTKDLIQQLNPETPCPSARGAWRSGRARRW